MKCNIHWHKTTTQNTIEKQLSAVRILRLDLTYCYLERKSIKTQKHQVHGWRQSPKNQKTPCVFWFFGLRNQKNTRKTKKNHLWSLNQKVSSKFCFFGFLVLIRFCCSATSTPGQAVEPPSRSAFISKLKSQKNETTLANPAPQPQNQKKHTYKNKCQLIWGLGFTLVLFFVLLLFFCCATMEYVTCTSIHMYAQYFYCPVYLIVYIVQYRPQQACCETILWNVAQLSWGGHSVRRQSRVLEACVAIFFERARHLYQVLLKKQPASLPEKGSSTYFRQG